MVNSTSSTHPASSSLTGRVHDLAGKFLTYYPDGKSTVAESGEPRHFRVMEVVGCGVNKQGQEFARVLAFDYDNGLSKLVNRSLKLERIAFSVKAQPLTSYQRKAYNDHE